MSDIKNYKSSGHSLSTGQVLSRPYGYEKGLLVFKEMLELLVDDLVAKNLTTDSVTWYISFDPKSLDENPYYNGPVAIDFYGRLHPKHANATVRLRIRTNSKTIIMEKVIPSFAAKVDHSLLIRRLGIAANNTEIDTGIFQLDMFTDFDELEKERALQRAMLEVRKKYGMNAVVKGMNLLEGATTIQRNTLFGRADIVTATGHEYTKSCMFVRNRYLVDNADLLLAAFDGQPGGTEMTIRYAKQMGIQVCCIKPVIK